MANTQRVIAEMLCKGLYAISSDSDKRWTIALRREIDQIDNDLEAFVFAMGGVSGLLPRALKGRLQEASTLSELTVSFVAGISRGLANPRICGLASVSISSLIGLAVMAMTEAPRHYLASNSAALGAGVAMLSIIWWIGRLKRVNSDALAVILSFFLLITSLFGITVDGVTRWISIAGVSMQTSLIVLPALLILFARAQTPRTSVSIWLTALGLALQPDRAMSGALFLALGALAVMRVNSNTLTALFCGTAAVWVASDQPDNLQAARYVTNVFSASFDVHAVMGMTMLLAVSLLFMPVASLIRSGKPQYPTAAVFGVTWSAIFVAAALGNYPTPVVGYGASSIFGYILCLAVLPSPGMHSKERQRHQHWNTDRLENKRLI